MRLTHMGFLEVINISALRTLHDEGKSEYNFGLHQKNYRGGLGHTLGDQNQPLFKSPYGSP